MAELMPAPTAARLILRGNGCAGMVVPGALFQGLTIPARPCRAACSSGWAALWLGPDEWLLLGAGAPAPAQAALAAALADVPHALVDVSHRQLAFRLAGAGAETLLAGAVPLDLVPAAFPVDMCVRTIFEKAEIVLWRTAIDAWHIEVWRSFAPYVRDLFEAIRAADGAAA